MLLDKHELRHKAYLKAEKELKQIREQDRKMPWIPVTKPYQDGWFIDLDFKDEVKRRDDYSHLRAVLDLCARRGRTKDAKLVSALRKCKRLEQAYRLFPRYDQGLYVPKFGGENLQWEHSYRSYFNASSPHLVLASQEQYDKLSPTSKKWIHYSKYDSEHSWFRGKRVYRCSIPDYFLRMKVRPAMVTHTKETDPALASREAELEKIVNAYWEHKSWHNWHGSRDRWENYFAIRRRRAHDRASIRAIIKGEKDDFEHLRKNINYD